MKNLCVNVRRSCQVSCLYPLLQSRVYHLNYKTNSHAIANFYRIQRNLQHEKKKGKKEGGAGKEGDAGKEGGAEK